MNNNKKWSEMNLKERTAELQRRCDIYKGIKEVHDELLAHVRQNPSSVYQEDADAEFFAPPTIIL